MVGITRRRFLAALAVTLSGLGFRRAAALPARPRIEPRLSMPPPPVEPVAALPEVYDAGWWVEPGGWMYHPTVGWLHLFQHARDVRRALCYGPPPPISFDLGEAMKG